MIQSWLDDERKVGLGVAIRCTSCGKVLATPSERVVTVQHQWYCQECWQEVIRAYK